MKAEIIDRKILAEAVKIYLQFAYPPHQVPDGVETIVECLRTSIDPGQFEHTVQEDQNRHYLRLGNQLFPHMKLAIIEVDEIGQGYLFSVDTHDRQVEISPNSPDYDELKEIQIANQNLKQQIEAAWYASGLPTERELLKSQSISRSPHLDYENQKRILVVDDDSATAETIRAIIEHHGYPAFVENNPFNVIDRLRETQFDLCVMDIMMPGLNGYGLVARIREAKLDNFPIIFASALSEDHIRKGLSDDFIRKPLLPKELMSKIEAHLRN